MCRLIIAVNDDFLCFAHLFAIAATHRCPIEINACAQASASTHGQVPRQGINSRLAGGRERMTPHTTSAKVKDLNQEFAIGTWEVVGDEEIGACECGILTGREVQHYRLQGMVDQEVKSY